MGDSMAAEIAEVYSYTEQPEFALNQAAFEGLMGQFGLSSRWLKMNSDEKSRAILLLLDHLELWDREERLRGARAVLYLAQGCWEECMSDTECWDTVRENVELLHKHGVFASFIKLSENYTAADSRAQGAFQASQKKPLLGVHGCSIGQAKADGCEMLTSKFDTSCPLENDGDKIELEFPFSAPNLPSAVSMIKFRIIGLEETASSCQSILEPSFNNQVTTTSDLDMICIMYPTIITK